MPVDVKGRIVYNPDAEEEYVLECKQLKITNPATGAIEEDIEDLRDRIIKAISEEFHVEPASVKITGYSLNLNFSIDGPINRTLDEFKEKNDEENP